MTNRTIREILADAKPGETVTIPAGTYEEQPRGGWDRPFRMLITKIPDKPRPALRLLADSKLAVAWELSTDLALTCSGCAQTIGQLKLGSWFETDHWCDQIDASWRMRGGRMPQVYVGYGEL